MDTMWPLVKNLRWYKLHVETIRPAAQEEVQEGDGEGSSGLGDAGTEFHEYDAVAAAKAVYYKYDEGDATDVNDWSTLVHPHYQRMTIHFYIQKGVRAHCFQCTPRLRDIHTCTTRKAYGCQCIMSMHACQIRKSGRSTSPSKRSSVIVNALLHARAISTHMCISDTCLSAWML